MQSSNIIGKSQEAKIQYEDTASKEDLELNNYVDFISSSISNDTSSSSEKWFMVDPNDESYSSSIAISGICLKENGEIWFKNVGETDAYNSTMTWKVQEPTIESYVGNEKILFYVIANEDSSFILGFTNSNTFHAVMSANAGILNSAGKYLAN